MGMNEIIGIQQTAFWNVFSWKKIIIYFLFKVLWIVFPWGQSTMGPINNGSALGEVGHRTGDKPIPEPMETWFSDAYMRHQTSVC